jgi:8-oxo-dGTP pyrophosphatase MutT (NUDIX family)
VIKAAGIAYMAHGEVLLLRRSDEGDAGGCWAFPGGKVEEGESLIEAAVRESIEEIGLHPQGKLTPFSNETNETVDYTTFIQALPDQFFPKLNEEHTEANWFDKNNLPEPLHPGVRRVLKKIWLNELDVAKGIRDGVYQSPTRFHNITLFAMRIAGTGVAFRLGMNEFVHRSASDYLNEDFLARCNGMLVIAEHPKKASLDSKEFADRVVGAICLPYIKGDEVWGIAKIYDDQCAETLQKMQWSTSPTVVFTTQAVNTSIPLEDGSTLLVEGSPNLVDHLAICEQGVWDKGKSPSGVELTNGVQNMADEKIEDKKADTNGAGDVGMADKLDKLLSVADALCSRMDALEAKKADAEPPKPEEKKADGEDVTEANKTNENGKAKEGEGKADAELTDEEKAAKEKKDAEEKDAKMADKARKDAEDLAAREKSDGEVRSRIDALEKKVPDEVPENEEAEMADAQAKADSVYMAFGKKAPPPLRGERSLGYRRRLIGSFKEHSPAWGKVNLNSLPAEAFAIAEEQIRADAMTFALSPTNAPEDTLRESVRMDSTGRRITTFHGKPDVWLSDFKLVKQRVAKINKEA